MKMTVRGMTLVLALVVTLPGPALGQDPGSDRQGMALFRGRCANCHGVDARGFRAPDLLDVPWSDRIVESRPRPSGPAKAAALPA